MHYVPLQADETCWACDHMAGEVDLPLVPDYMDVDAINSIASCDVYGAWKKICRVLDRSIKNDNGHQQNLIFIFNTEVGGGTAAMGHWVTVRLIYTINPAYVFET
jgi:hypothetical protein